MTVIRMNEFELAHKGISSQEAVGLLRECREVTIRRLSAALVRMMGKVDDTLFEWSEKAENRADSSFYFDAMREVRMKRASIEIGFKAQLVEGFNRELRKENESSAGTLLAEQMCLVDEAGLEESLAVKNMVSKIEVDCKQGLHHLNRRMGLLLNDPELTRAKNPIGPEVICNAFLEAVGEVSSGVKVKLIILKLFDRHVLGEEIEDLYAEINRFLIEKGVLPELRHEIKRTPGARTGQKQAADDDTEANNEDLYATLQKLMLRGVSGGAVMNAAVIGSLVGALTDLQQGRLSRIEGAGGAIDPAALTSGTVNVIREIKETALADKVGEVEGMVIDVIAMLFDYIFDDPNIPPSIKALLGRLQIPMLKVGMLDREFFSKRSHPARRLLNALAHAAVGWNEDGDDRRLYDKMESIVRRVLENFDRDLGLFEALLKEFQDYLAVEERKAEHQQAHSAKLIQGAERLRLAKQRVRVEVERRNKASLPKFVRQFLATYWQSLLLVTFVKEGEDSIAWKRSLTAMDNLAWSLQPKATIEERDRLVRLLPSLLRVLREGMKLISMREDDFQSFLEQLAPYHAGVVNAVPRGTGAANDAPAVPASIDDPLAELGAEPVVEDTRVTTATIRRLVQSGDLAAEDIALVEDDVPEEPVDDEFVAQARDLKLGSWVEFQQEDGATLRAKLTWVSPVTGIYLFTNRQGLKACDKTLQGLAADLRRGSARLLDDAPLFERAVSSVIEGLRQAGGAAG